MVIRKSFTSLCLVCSLFVLGLNPKNAAAAGSCPIGDDVLACCIYLCQDHPFSHACELGCVVDDIVFGVHDDPLLSSAEFTIIVEDKEGRREVYELTTDRDKLIQRLKDTEKR